MMSDWDHHQFVLSPMRVKHKLCSSTLFIMLPTSASSVHHFAMDDALVLQLNLLWARAFFFF